MNGSSPFSIAAFSSNAEQATSCEQSRGFGQYVPEYTSQAFSLKPPKYGDRRKHESIPPSQENWKWCVKGARGELYQNLPYEKNLSRSAYLGAPGIHVVWLVQTTETRQSWRGLFGVRTHKAN